jgi:hypothetical protein
LERISLVLPLRHTAAFSGYGTGQGVVVGLGGEREVEGVWFCVQCKMFFINNYVENPQV